MNLGFPPCNNGSGQRVARFAASLRADSTYMPLCRCLSFRKGTSSALEYIRVFYTVGFQLPFVTPSKQVDLGQSTQLVSF